MQEERFQHWWQHYEALDRLWQSERLDESRALIQRGLDEFPGEPALWLSMATQELMEGLTPDHVREAKAHVNSAVQLAPDSPTVLLDAGLTMFDAGEFKLSGKYASAAARRADAFESPHLQAALANLLGRLAMAAGRPAAAEEPLRLAIRLDPDVPDHHIRLVAALRSFGRTDEARELAAEASRRFPDEPRIEQLRSAVGRQQTDVPFSPRTRRYRVTRTLP